MNNEQKILSVVVGLLQTVRDGYVANSDLPGEVLNLSNILNNGNRISQHQENGKLNNAILCQKLIRHLGTYIV